MTLPSPELLAALPPEDLRRFAARIRAVGLQTERVERVNAIPATPIGAMRMAIVRWHLRRERDPGANAMRLFLYHDTLEEAEVRGVLGDALDLERAVAAGLLARDEAGRLHAPWCLAMVNELFVLSDDPAAGGDAVMGLGRTTDALCRASYPEARVGSVLDLGCGAGAAALLCASRADRVVGTDINPRAIAIAKINAALNGIENVEFRTGDLFAPAFGEAFDLVVSQPPFLARPAADEAATTLHGGTRGDELPLRLLRELPPHLAPGGRAILLVEWPIVDGDPIEKRIRAAIPQLDLSLLELETGDGSLDEHCAGYAVAETRSIGAEFEARFAERRSHFETIGVRGLRLALTVVARSPRTPGWTSTVEIRPLPEVELRRGNIDRMIAARDLLGAGIDAMLAARMRIPEGTRFAEDDGGRVVATLPARALVPSVRTSKNIVALVSAVSEAACVRDVAVAVAEERGAPLHSVVDDLVPALRNALLYGLLELA